MTATAIQAATPIAIEMAMRLAAVSVARATPERTIGRAVDSSAAYRVIEVSKGGDVALILEAAGGERHPEMREATGTFREPPDVATGASRIASAWAGQLRQSGAILVVAAGFLSLSRAFGTGQVSFFIRFAFWAVLLAIGTGANLLAHRALARRRPHASPMARAVLVSLAIGLPLTPLVWLIVRLTFGELPDGWHLWADLLLANLAISGAMATLHVLTDPVPTERVAPPAPLASETPAKPAFLNRLPSRLRGAALYAVEAQDHYLRLHTSRGSDLILMRLSDALAELDGLEGARVHRSWWVARDAPRSVRRDGGRVSLILPEGIEAPVSRTYLAALRQAGWFT